MMSLFIQSLSKNLLSSLPSTALSTRDTVMRSGVGGGGGGSENFAETEYSAGSRIGTI